jgi:hypothetical protein
MVTEIYATTDQTIPPTAPAPALQETAPTPTVAVPTAPAATVIAPAPPAPTVVLPPAPAPITTAAPGGVNEAGCPKDQWVNGYYRSDGTYVSGYWRNSPTDSCDSSP